MALDQTELAAFSQFVTERLQNGQSASNLEEAVQTFRAYQDDVERLRKHLAPALVESKRREAKPLNADDVKQRIRTRLAEHGITD
jgi:hypothetical protein